MGGVCHFRVDPYLNSTTVLFDIVLCFHIAYEQLTGANPDQGDNGNVRTGQEEIDPNSVA